MAFPILSVLSFIPNLLGYWQKKQEMQLRWFELIFSIIKDLLAFTIAHLRVILVLLILGYCLFNYLKALNQAKTAIKEKEQAVKVLNDKINSDIAEAKKRDAENRLNTILLQKKTDAEIAKYKSALNVIYAKQKGLKNEISINKRDIANWRERVRVELESKTIQAARVFKNDTDRLAIRDSNTALLEPISKELEVCQEAGAICAADYNLCKSYVDNQQSIIGVSK
jgi:hypothetical protein